MRSVLALTWPAIVVAIILIGGGVATGWILAGRRPFMLVRFIDWWLTRVVVPALRCGTWSVRAGIIFANNTLVLALVLAAGASIRLSLVAVAGLGFTLGIGLRILAGKQDRFAAPSQLSGKHLQLYIRVGIVLNLLEPPAILLVAGMSITRGLLAAPAAESWQVFFMVAMPLLLVAAGGEALWLGACGHDETSRVSSRFPCKELDTAN